MRPRSVSLFRGRIFSLRRSNDNRVCFNKIARGLTRIRGYNLFEQVSITPIQKLWSVLDNRSNSYLLICSFNKFFFLENLFVYYNSYISHFTYYDNNNNHGNIIKLLWYVFRNYISKKWCEIKMFRPCFWTHNEK